MRYSQRDGVIISLSRLVYCIHVYYAGCVIISGVPFLYVYGYLPWHGHVLPGTLIINIMCANQIYLQG